MLPNLNTTYTKELLMKHYVLLPVLILAATLTASASKYIDVDLSQQRACAYENGRAVICGNISSGRPGRRTPTGHFHVLEKDIDHVSSKYPEPHGGAKMHYMLRLTGSGIAMHLGHVPNYPASHGCIRMQNGFAQQMYRWASVGIPVRVHGYPPRRVSRSGFRSTYGTRSANPTDALAMFMGYRVHRTTARTRHAARRIRHVRRKQRRRTARHAHPLDTLVAR